MTVPDNRAEVVATWPASPVFTIISFGRTLHETVMIIPAASIEKNLPVCI
jgi:hypothetical protein